MATPVQPLKFPMIVDLEDDFDVNTWKTKYSMAKVPEVPMYAEFTDDPVALSIMSYFVWKNNPARRWASIDEVGRPNSEARQMAHELRTYYTHRNTMKTLMGTPPSEFQHKMLSFLMDQRQLEVKELGLLYRLPYFYQEDLALDKIFEGATDLKEQSPPGFSMTSWTTLTPICEVLRSRKSGDFIYFWFQNPEGERCVYDVKSDNKLLSVFRSLFKWPELQVSCFVKMERFKGSHIRTKYWRLSNLELQ